MGISINVVNDCKKTRIQTFKQLISSGEYIDGATDYCLLLPYAKEHNLDVESRLWVSFLYGLSYSCTTAMRFHQEFNTLIDVSPKNLKRFWNSNKSTLWFNPDKKYLKNNDQVIPAIRNLMQVSGGNLEAYLVPILHKGFDATYKEIINKWSFFGPMGAYLFFDAIYGLLPELYSDPVNLDWKNVGKTVVEGMAILLCQEDQEEYNYEDFNHMVDSIQRRFDQPKVIIESTLCAFRKLFKGSRYYGYYADRMLEECHNTDTILQESYNIDVWKYRKQTIPSKFRGETQGWTGIRADRKKLFIEKGVLYEQEVVS